MEIKAGTFAKSKAGHDSDKIYVIMNCDREYVYLVDGVLRKINNPKKKKKKHIQIINHMAPVVGEKLINNKALINEDIKKAIKDYKSLY